MKIIVQKESDIKELFKEAVHILAHLNYFTDLWEQDHGAASKERKKFWKERAAAFLEKVSAQPLPSPSNAVNIEVKTEEQ